MCHNTNSMEFVTTAKPMRVYKVVKKVGIDPSTKEVYALSAAQRFVYKMGKVYSTPFKEILDGAHGTYISTKHKFSFEQGYHSYPTWWVAAKVCSSFSDEIVVCEIPAGSNVSTGEANDKVPSLLSDVIIVRKNTGTGWLGYLLIGWIINF